MRLTVQQLADKRPALGAAMARITGVSPRANGTPTRAHTDDNTFPIQLWHDLLWYAYQPHSGLSATAYTRGQACKSLRRQLAAAYDLHLGDIQLRPVD